MPGVGHTGVNDAGVPGRGRRSGRHSSGRPVSRGRRWRSVPRTSRLAAPSSGSFRSPDHLRATKQPRPARSSGGPRCQLLVSCNPVLRADECVGAHLSRFVWPRVGPSSPEGGSAGRSLDVGRASSKVLEFAAKSTSAVLTVPAVRPGAVWCFQYRFVWAMTLSGVGAPWSVTSKAIRSPNSATPRFRSRTRRTAWCRSAHRPARPGGTGLQAGRQYRKRCRGCRPVQVALIRGRGSCTCLCLRTDRRARSLVPVLTREGVARPRWSCLCWYAAFPSAR